VNIWDARRSAGGTIDGSIAGCERDGLFRPDEDEVLLLWLDYRALRGIPSIGRGVSGHPTDSFVPGSDEHLENIA
jgi:hypothetical protein